MWLLHLKVLEVTVLLALEQPTEDASNSRYHLRGRCCQCKFDILHGNIRALYLWPLEAWTLGHLGTWTVGPLGIRVPG